MTESAIACDLIIEAGWVVPVQPHGVVLENYAVVVSGDLIVDVLPIADTTNKYSAKKTVARPDAVLLPGLVNAHTHNPMTLMRGVADDFGRQIGCASAAWPGVPVDGARCSVLADRLHRCLLAIRRVVPDGDFALAPRGSRDNG